MSLKIPETIISNPDRGAAFRALKSWMETRETTPAKGVESAFSSGASNVDEILQGGYVPGKITEIVEKQGSCGAQSLIHSAIVECRKKLKFIALIDAFNQFDPQSEKDPVLECLLWVRCAKVKDAIKACDIIVRDGNFALLVLDLRPGYNQRLAYIQPQSWYRIQRICEQSQLPLVAFTNESLIPCAHQRILLNRTLKLDFVDCPNARVLDSVSCEPLKRIAVNFQSDKHRFASG